MRIVLRLAGALVALVLLIAFASAHFSQRVTLHLGMLTLRDVSLPVVLYGAVIVGMGVMLLLGLRADLKTRSLLERYRAMAELERAAREAGKGGGEGPAESPLEDFDRVAGPE